MTIFFILELTHYIQLCVAMVINASLLEQLEKQWQEDNFLGRSDILDVASEGRWSDGEPKRVAGMDVLLWRPLSNLKQQRRRDL